MLRWALSIAVAGGIVLVLPEFIGLYWTRVLTNIFFFAVMAQSINIIAGYVGYPAFGNVVFFGLGAYGTAIALVKIQAPFLVGLTISLATCTVVVLLVGPPLLKLRGHYFAIATLGLNEAIKAVVNNLTELTGGGAGLSLPLLNMEVVDLGVMFYRMYFGLACIGILIAALMRSTRFGFACLAVRANEDGAESMGINSTYYKTAAWLVSALLAGAAGSFYARWLSYIDPQAVFDMTISVKAFVMFLLGGAATPFGPILGAALIEALTTVTWSYLLHYHLAVLGMIIMMVAVAMPLGLPHFLRVRVRDAMRLLSVNPDASR